MKKAFLGSLILVFIFTSCKKQDDFAGSASGENQKTVLGSGEPQPTGVTAPAIFFLKKTATNSANLFKIDNLTAAAPTFTQVKQFLNQENIGQYLQPQYQWTYNTSTNQIITTDNLKTNNQFFTESMYKLTTSPSVSISKTQLPSADVNPAQMMVFNPTNSRIFYSILGGVWSCNPDGTGKKFISPPGFGSTIWAMAVDFNDGKIYVAENKSFINQPIGDSIFVMDLDGSNKHVLKAIPSGETLTANFYDGTWRPTLKVDQGKIFLSTKSSMDQADNKFHLFSISTSGVGAWKELFEAPGNKYNSSSFSFDILPGEKLYYTSFQDGLNIDINVIGRMNLDGTKIEPLLISSQLIPRLVVALPKP